MLKLLIAVDGSENSLPAVRYVTKLKAAHAVVRAMLLHVHYEPVPLGTVAAQISRERARQLEHEHADGVFAEAETILSEAGIDHHREFSVAVDIAPQIVRRAEEAACDGILMGSRGGGGLTKLVIGSTALEVLKLTRMPVTIVR